MKKKNNKKYRPKGLTLLVTLMVLVILAVVIVQFQVDATLQNRASSYRIERLQCRYAAESGIALGSHIIRMIYRKGVAEDREKFPGDLPDSWQDPNAVTEPNLPDSFINLQTTPVEDLPWFIIQKKTLDVNGVEVTVEVHDENAKWPLVWLLSSPFDRAGRSDIVGRSFEKYAELLQLDDQTFDDAVDLINSLSTSLPLPPPPVSYSGTGLRMAPKGRRGSWIDTLAEVQYRHKVMGNFARYWYKHFELRPDDPLMQELEEMPVSFADCVSIWGAFHININTAPPPVLQSVFQPLGLDPRTFFALIDYRDQTPFYSITQLEDIKEITTIMRQKIQPLIIPKSRTYSVHVNARLGRTSCHLVSCVYINHRAETENLALIIRSGD